MVAPLHIAGRYVDEEVELREHPDGVVLHVSASGFAVDVHLNATAAARLRAGLRVHECRLRGVPCEVSPDEDTAPVDVETMYR